MLLSVPRRGFLGFPSFHCPCSPSSLRTRRILPRSCHYQQMRPHRLLCFPSPSFLKRLSRSRPLMQSSDCLGTTLGLAVCWFDRIFTHWSCLPCLFSMHISSLAQLYNPRFQFSRGLLTIFPQVQLVGQKLTLVHSLCGLSIYRHAFECGQRKENTQKTSCRSFPPELMSAGFQGSRSCQTITLASQFCFFYHSFKQLCLVSSSHLQPLSNHHFHLFL